jgi:hypothetical protein
MHPSRPEVLFMQKHWDVMRSDDAGDNWREISGNLPSDFGFPIDVHAHEPETIYVVPIKSDSEHYPPEGKLRVYRSRTGGNEWEALTNGLPQENCYVNVLRDAMAVDTLARAASTSAPPAGRSTLARRRRHVDGHRPRPAGGALGRGADAAMIRRPDPASSAHAGEHRQRGRGAGRRPVTLRTVLDALEARYPMLRVARSATAPARSGGR